MMKYRTIAILLGMLAFIGCEHQQTDVKPGGISADGKRDGVYVEITLSNDAPSVGEPITLTVQARTETGVSLQTPLIPLDEGDALGAFHVLNIQPTLRRPAPEGGHLWTQHLIIDSLEPGAHAIPPLNFPFSSPTSDSMEQRLEIASIPVSVTSSQPDGMTTPMDIQGWIDLPGPPLWPWLLASGAAAITIVSGFIWWLSRIRPEGPPPTPAELARASLRVLRQRNLLAHGESDGFYTTLSQIIRQYLEGRFGLSAPRQTTAEFLEDTKQDACLSSSQQVHLRQFLRTADLVKFAGHEPAEAQGMDAINEADRFIEECELATEDDVDVKCEAMAC